MTEFLGLNVPQSLGADAGSLLPAYLTTCNQRNVIHTGTNPNSSLYIWESAVLLPEFVHISHD